MRATPEALTAQNVTTHVGRGFHLTETVESRKAVRCTCFGADDPSVYFRTDESAVNWWRSHIAKHDKAARKRRELRARRSAGTVDRPDCRLGMQVGLPRPLETFARGIIDRPADFTGQANLQVVHEITPHWRVTCGCGWASRQYPISNPSPIRDAQRHIDTRRQGQAARSARMNLAAIRAGWANTASLLGINYRWSHGRLIVGKGGRV